MKSKDEAAKGILKLLADMKWPSEGFVDHGGDDGAHGGLHMLPGHPRGASGNVLVRKNEMYIGRYSPLADAIRDWQDTPHEPNYDVMKFQQIHDQRVRDAKEEE